MKKIAILFIILLISGCSKQTVSENNSKSLETLITNRECSAIEKSTIRNKCYLKLAEQNNSVDECDKIVGDEMGKGDCYKIVAVSEKDISMCENIKTNSIKYACLAGINESEKACYKLDKKDQNICLINSAEALGQKSICKDIENKNSQENCYEKVAAQITDETLCEKITDSNTKDICYLRTAKNKKDESLCNQISNDHNQNTCLTNTAIVKNDITLCSQITDQTKKDNCLSEIAINLFSTEICDQIQTEKKKIECKNILNNK